MINQKYKLDMVPGGSVPTIVHVSQYDAGSRDLTFELYSGGMPWAVPEGATVTIDGTKADHKAFSYVASSSGSAVTVTVTQQMTAARGLAECQLTVTQGSSVLGSANFALDVERAALPEDADMSQTDIASLEAWKNQALTAKEAAEAAQGKSEAAQAKAETAQGKAEAAQGKAEVAQGKAEAAQSAGEAARDAAKTAQSKAEAARDAAKTAQAKAETAQGKAEAAKAAAETARDAAAASAQSAETSAQNASASATASANSADQAEAAREAAVVAQGKAEAATSGKADKKTPSAAKNVALLGADGNLLDSGKQLTPEDIGAVSISTMDALHYDNAGAHNAIYRGAFLGTSVTAHQYNAISAGTFEDLYIGDYWTIGGVNYRIAAFDYYLNCGDTACTAHHAVIVPDTCLYNAQMHNTSSGGYEEGEANTTAGGYVGSDMYKSNLGQAKTTIKGAFSGHVLKHRVYLTNAVANGRASGGAWCDSEVDLMCEQMVYGSGIFSPVSDGSNVPANYHVETSQLPLFQHEPSHICNRNNWWLRDVITASLFAVVYYCGYATYYAASDSLGVRPAFCIS